MNQAKAQAVRKKALEYAKAREWEKALKEFLRLPELEAHNPNVYNEIGDIYLKLGNRLEAFNSFYKAIDSYEAVSLFNNAVAVCKKIIRLNPNDHLVYGKLARLRSEQGFEKEAASYGVTFLDNLVQDATVSPDELRDKVTGLAQAMGESPEVLERASEYLVKWEFKKEAGELLTTLAAIYRERGAADRLKAVEARMVSIGVTPPAGRATPVAPEQPGSPPVAAAPPAQTPAASRAQTPAASNDYLENDQVDLDGGDAAPGPAAAPSPPPPSAPRQQPAPAAPQSAPPSSSPPAPQEQPVNKSGGATAQAVAEPEPPPAPAASPPPAQQTPGPPATPGTEAPEAPAATPPPDPPAATPPPDPPAADPPAADPRAADPPAATPPPDPPASEEQAPPVSQGPPSELADDEVWIPDAELPDDLRKGNTEGGGEVVGVSEIVGKFNQEVSADVDDEDHRSHYDLGMAYLEMDLLPEAIREFQYASNSSLYQVRCLEMIGMCFLKQNQPRLAIKQLEKGLSLVGDGDRESLGLQYNLGLAYEMTGDLEKALACFEDVYVVDVTFRDVSEKVKKYTGQ